MGNQTHTCGCPSTSAYCEHFPKPSEQAMAAAHRLRRYAVCGDGSHIARAFAFMAGVKLTVHRAGGRETLKCHCAAAAEWYLREVG